MAFGARRVYPNDLRPRVAIGVNLPFSNPGVFQPNYQTKDAIKNNLINYFLTNPGERIENPLFGAGLRQYIFTQIETENLDFIKEDIQTKLDDNFSNIQVESIEVLRNINENTIQINIKYSIPNTGINDTLELNFR
jgi:phage baseplate assembly protein W|tara:strand:- start:5267 stop:5674 length:408 start_codon:yes stop_codon:yes gene_type:complete